MLKPNSCRIYTHATSHLSLTETVQGYYGYVTFVWVYGIFIGGYSYTLKMYVYQKVRARNFAKAWGYVQCSQALPNMFGIPLAGYINIGEADQLYGILEEFWERIQKWRKLEINYICMT